MELRQLRYFVAVADELNFGRAALRLRIAGGSIDLAICWVRRDDLAVHDLDARLIGADRLYALSPGADPSPVRAEDTVVLVDADVTSWASWNRYAEEFAKDTAAWVVRIDDGGITGPAFFDHVRRLRRPVINSPKGQTARVPPDLVRRPVVGPAPYWTWALVWRRSETRPAVRAAVEVLTGAVGSLGLDAEGVWLPVGDPFRGLRG